MRSSTIFLLLFTFLCTLSTRSYAQWNDFNIYVTPSQWFDKTNAYFKANNFRNYLTLTQGGITPSATNDSTIAPGQIERFMLRHYPSIDSEGILALDWEAKVFDNLKDLPETDPRFKYSEKQFIALVNEIRKHRPKVKVGFYGMTFRGYNDWQKTNYNRPGALDNIFSNVDFISPSLYIGYTNEERGREFNLNFLKDNLDIAFTYGRRHNIPVIPFMWHRVIESNILYSRAILQKEVFADYIKFVSSYSSNGFKASGVLLWDDGYHAPRLKNLEGVANWLKGNVTNVETYDELCVSLMESIVSLMNTK